VPRAGRARPWLPCLPSCGGPVYTLARWDPTRKVLAAGMIDNGLFTVGCPPGSVTGTCFRNVGFVDINYALVAQGAGLLTS
jgi:hypothetical protein